MTRERTEIINPPLEQFLSRTLPADLRPGARPPQGYQGSRLDFEESQTELRKAWREDAVKLYHLRILQGWTPAELASGAEVDSYADGSPVRPIPASVPPGRMAQGAQAYQSIKRAGLVLDVIMMQRLEQCYSGAYRGRQDALDDAISSAYQALQARQDETHTQREGATTIRMVVHCGFRCPHLAIVQMYKRGEYWLTEEEAFILLEWRATTGAQFERPGAPADAAEQGGYSAWPPFELDNEAEILRSKWVAGMRAAKRAAEMASR